MSRKLLILDVDETLIYATHRKLEGGEDFRVGQYFVYKRPHVDAFLAFSARHFEVAVWSSASEDYLAAVCSQLLPRGYPLVFQWDRKRCVRRIGDFRQGDCFIKDLAKVKRQGFPLEGVIVVDDSQEKLQRHYGNLVRVRPFTGDSDDEELRLLVNYLPILSRESNVRRIDKRGWRGIARAIDD